MSTPSRKHPNRTGVTLPIGSMACAARPQWRGASTSTAYQLYVIILLGMATSLGIRHSIIAALALCIFTGVYIYATFLTRHPKRCSSAFKRRVRDVFYLTVSYPQDTSPPYFHPKLWSLMVAVGVVLLIEVAAALR